jgi:death on curing protein
MSRRWRWVDKTALVLLHDESLAEHGGAAGMRDECLFESALARPENIAAYKNADIAPLAAAHGVGLAKNHPFVDGNKRTAFLAVGLVLALNGYRLCASQLEATKAMLAVTAGELSEPDFAAWIRQNSKKLKKK